MPVSRPRGALQPSAAVQRAQLPLRVYQPGRPDPVPAGERYQAVEPGHVSVRVQRGQGMHDGDVL